MLPTQTVAQRYAALESEREPYLQRARDAAKLTLPSLVPPAGHTGTSKLPTPYQAVGARGVNNLAAKYLLTLFPPNTPFFRLSIDDFTLEELTQQEGARAEVEEGLNRIERTVQAHTETSALRVSAVEALRQLIVAGNVLLFLQPEGGYRVYRLDSYVVRRDVSGNLLEIIAVDTLAPQTLSPEHQALLGEHELSHPKSEIKVYTYVRRAGSRWETYQELEGQIVPGTSATYPLHALPWIAPRLTKVDGEHYGRGYVEEYIGDLRSLEALSQAIVEGVAAAAKVLIFVRPNGTTRARVVQEAENLAVLVGDANDCSVLTLDKHGDFRVAMEHANRIEERLAYAFLMNSAIQRPGERVTAEEIRYMASELEDALGGQYSILSQEFQAPIVKALMHHMERRGELPSLPEGIVNPLITAGLEALGRGHDLNKLHALVESLAPLAQAVPEIFRDYLNIGDLIKRNGTALGIDMKGLVRSEEEVQQKRQQEQMEAMMTQMAPGLMPPSPHEQQLG